MSKEIIKRDDAIERWCPFVRMRGTVGESYNRNPHKDFDQMIPVSTRCIVEKCIAWQAKDECSGRCGMLPG